MAERVLITRPMEETPMDLDVPGTEAPRPVIHLVMPINPVPTAIEVGIAEAMDPQGNRVNLVQLTFHTATGVQVYFCTSDYTAELVERLTAAATTARTGLTVVSEVPRLVPVPGRFGSN